MVTVKGFRTEEHPVARPRQRDGLWTLGQDFQGVMARPLLLGIPFAYVAASVFICAQRLSPLLVETGILGVLVLGWAVVSLIAFIFPALGRPA
jgi:hypothetical protein